MIYNKIPIFLDVHSAHSFPSYDDFFSYDGSCRYSYSLYCRQIYQVNLNLSNPIILISLQKYDRPVLWTYCETSLLIVDSQNGIPQISGWIIPL